MGMQNACYMLILTNSAASFILLGASSLSRVNASLLLLFLAGLARFMGTPDDTQMVMVFLDLHNAPVMIRA